MSSDDERDLSRRLASALGTITPPPAPVDTVLRKGRARRARRHIAAAAGLAVAAAVGVGVAAPALIRPVGPSAPVSPARNPVVTVNPVGPGSPPGLIGSGRINGRKWRIVVQRPGTAGAGKGQQCVQVSGAGGGSQSCEPAGSGPSGTDDPVALGSLSGSLTQAQFGVLAPDVTRVTVTLGGGRVLVLHPVTAYGQRYVAFALPLSLPVTRVVAYSGLTELRYAVPFNGRAGADVSSWLRPGQRGLRRGTYPIGSGETVHVGPWGYCVTGREEVCLDTQSGSLGNSVGGLAVGPAGADWVTGTAAAAVEHVLVHLSGGSTLRVRAVRCGGPRFYAFVVPRGRRALRVDYYSASRQLLASQQAGLP